MSKDSVVWETQYIEAEFSTVQCSTVRYSTLKYSTVQNSTVHYSTTLGHRTPVTITVGAGQRHTTRDGRHRCHQDWGRGCVCVVTILI